MTYKSFLFFGRVFRWSFLTDFVRCQDFSHGLAMQRTASQPAIYLLRIRHSRFACVASGDGLAVADLVSR
jgi:hypothetical protein